MRKLLRVGPESKKHLFVIRMSYFENGTQLLMFRNEILAHLFIYHIILQNRSGYAKVEGGDSGVHLRTKT